MNNKLKSIVLLWNNKLCTITLQIGGKRFIINKSINITCFISLVHFYVWGLCGLLRVHGSKIKSRWFITYLQEVEKIRNCWRYPRRNSSANWGIRCERKLCYRNKILVLRIIVIIISIMDVIFIIGFSKKTSYKYE